MFECNDIAYNDPLALFQPEMTLTCHWVFIKKKGKMYVFPRFKCYPISLVKYQRGAIRIPSQCSLNEKWCREQDIGWEKEECLENVWWSILLSLNEQFERSFRSNKKEKVNKEDDRNRELKEWFIKSYPGYGIWSSESLLLCQEIFFER